MKTFRFIAISLTALLLISCKPPGFSNQVAVVDLNLIAKTLGRDDLIVKNVKSANDNLNQQLEKIAENLRQQLDKEKSKLGDKPSIEEEQQFAQLIQKANDQLNQTKQVAIQKSQQLQNSLIVEFRNEVSKVSREIAQQNGYLTVLAINDSLLWADKTVDITNEVITEMRYSVYRKSAENESATTGK